MSCAALRRCVHLSRQPSVEADLGPFVRVLESKLSLLSVATSLVQLLPLLRLGLLILFLDGVVEDTPTAAPSRPLALDQFGGLEKHKSDGEKSEFDIVLRFVEHVVCVGSEPHRLLHALAMADLLCAKAHDEFYTPPTIIVVWIRQVGVSPKKTTTHT